MPSQARMREVPEDRIKMLSVGAFYELDACPEAITAMQDIMIRDMGLEIARKLFEHRKVLIHQNDKMCHCKAEIEVIVPKEPPCQA